MFSSRSRSSISRSLWRFAPLCLLLAISLLSSLQAQNAPALPPVVAEAAAAFTGTTTLVNQVQLQGTANLILGSLEDSGSFTATISLSAAAQTQANLAASGTLSETHDPVSPTMTCQWSRSGGSPHALSPANCVHPVDLFLPSLFFQAPAIPSGLNVIDLGTGTVGTVTTISYRHLQANFLIAGTTSSFQSLFAAQTQVDLGLDPTTLLPAVLSYQVTPDSGGTPLLIEIDYSNYQFINGVEIPSEIQRYVNGSLQLQIAVQSTQVD